ncbi:MAG: adenosylcobinamide-phosphate synthase CbiB [Dysgonomonas sp.]
MDTAVISILLPFILGWLLDLMIGDPPYLPHPVVGFGKIISWSEKLLNKGDCRMLKGALLAITLILSSFIFMFFLLKGLGQIHPYLSMALSAIVIFYCLAGTTLIREVKQVFIALESSVEDGRRQVARIVGRDTSNLSPQQIRTAALETLSENLSDGVITPMFWFMLLGVPGMFAYKMINTLDSMLGYKNERYRQFGCWAARIDDVANYIPARLTAFLMIIATGRLSLFSFLRKYGKLHASPNSGYPEAALAGILDCRFGGPNTYFGKVMIKPYIGNNERNLTMRDMLIATRVNRSTEKLMISLIAILTMIVNMI